MFFWILDVLVRLRTAVQADDQLLTRQVDIMKRYAASWLCFDVLVLVPDIYNFIQMVNDDQFLTGTLRAAKVIRIVQCLRVMRLVKAWLMVPKLPFRRFELSPAARLVASVSRVLVLCLVAIHWLACVWFAVGVAQDGWAAADLRKAPFWQQYTRSVQWAMSRLPPSAMSSNMELNTEEERWLSLVATGILSASGPVFISYLTNVMADIGRQMKQQQQTLRAVRKYCEQHKVGSSYVPKIKRYVRREHQRQQLDAEMKILQTMPEGLVRELFHATRSRYLCSHALFDKIGQQDSAMEVQLCNQAISESTVLAGDVIFQRHALAKGMHIIGDGCGLYYSLQCSPESSPRLQSLTSTLHKFRMFNIFSSEGYPRDLRMQAGEEDLHETVVNKGDFISEQALWIQAWKHQGRFQALSDTRRLLLQTDILHDVLQDYPGILAEAVVYARVYLEEANRAAIYPGLTDLPIMQDEDEESAEVSVIPRLFRRRATET
ncbi:unnamed protein product [Effrenium voratum]|nr:unnamed protein product [Effrenium voratum]